jgi:hypothetical protein
MTDPTPLPPESADAAADGVRLAELVEEVPLSRASVFEVVKALGITTVMGPGADGRGRVAWLSSADAERVRTAAHAVHHKEVRIADLGRPSRQTRQTTALAVSAGSADAPDPAPFLARLEAAERAVRSGLALSTAETGWILGCRPGGAEVLRGGIRAVHLGRDQWRLVSADSPDALRNVSADSPDSADTM